jgi:uncharacterized membrane protein
VRRIKDLEYKERLVAFTDAIIAIAATIMVLELVTPEDTTLQGLLSQWPVFIAYLTSFDLIYLVWLNHHNAFQKIEHVTIRIFVLNGIWIFFLTLVPFTTRWVGEHPNDTLPEFLYVFIMFAWTLMFQIMDNQILKDFPGTKPDVTNNRKVRIPLYLAYAAAMIVSFFAPIASLIMILVIVVILTVGIFRMIHK